MNLGCLEHEQIGTGRLSKPAALKAAKSASLNHAAIAGKLGGEPVQRLELCISDRSVLADRRDHFGVPFAIRDRLVWPAKAGSGIARGS
jgi:hypothetical protein